MSEIEGTSPRPDCQALFREFFSRGNEGRLRRSKLATPQAARGRCSVAEGAVAIDAARIELGGGVLDDLRVVAGLDGLFELLGGLHHVLGPLLPVLDLLVGQVLLRRRGEADRGDGGGALGQFDQGVLLRRQLVLRQRLLGQLAQLQLDAVGLDLAGLLADAPAGRLGVARVALAEVVHNVLDRVVIDLVGLGEVGAGLLHVGGLVGRGLDELFEVGLQVLLVGGLADRQDDGEGQEGGARRQHLVRSHDELLIGWEPVRSLVQGSRRQPHAQSRKAP